MSRKVCGPGVGRFDLTGVTSTTMGGCKEERSSVCRTF